MRVPVELLVRVELAVEIGFSLFDSYAVVNPFIAWRNFKLKGRPEKERAWNKYGIREARLQIITRWCKRCSRHYKQTRPHRKKRLWIVTAYDITCAWGCITLR